MEGPITQNVAVHEFALVSGTQTVASLAKAWGIPLTDLWLPCVVSEGSRSRSIIEIDEPTPIAFVMPPNDVPSVSTSSALPLANRTVIFDRLKILEELKVFPPRPRQFSVPEVTLARSKGVLYVRATPGRSGGRMRVTDGTIAMKRRISTEESIREGSSFPLSAESILALEQRAKGKSPVPSGATSVASTTPAGVPKVQSQDRMEELVSLRLKNAKFMSDAGSAEEGGERKRDRADERDPSSSAMQRAGEDFLEKLHQSIRKVRSEPPLHLVKLIGGNFKEIILRVGANFQLNGRVWLRPDLGVIAYQHLPEANRGAAGAASRLFAPQRLIAVIPILHAILKPRCVEDDFFEHEPTLVDHELPDMLKRLSHRGYKIVLVEHFPMLHHGNAYALQMISKRIVHFMETHLPTIPIQVVLSVGSHYSATQPGVSRCLLPNAGLYHVYLYHYNGQIEADTERSFVVKTAVERVGGYGFASLTFDEQDGFASCCGRKGLQTVPFGGLKDLTEQLCS